MFDDVNGSGNLQIQTDFQDSTGRVLKTSLNLEISRGSNSTGEVSANSPFQDEFNGMLKVVMPHFPRSLCCPNQRCDFDPSTIYCVICNCPAKTTSMSGIPKLSFSRRFQWYAQSCDAMFSSISVPSQPDCIELMVRHQELLPDVSRPTSREDDSIFYKLLYCYAQDSMASY